MKRIDHFLGLAALTLGILILSPAIHEHQAIAGEAVLTWDQSPGPDVAGYKIYFGTASHLYGSPINAGNKTTFTFTGLDDGTYYFSVTAYDTAGNESGFSNEASKTISAASSVPSGNSQASSSSGGCGMVNPKDGTPPGPGQAADMVGLLAMTLISILRKEIRVTRRFQMNKLQYRHIILASIPLLLTLIAASANATTYYVNQNFTGASDSNSGTDATHPFLTIARAVCGSQDCINSPNAAIAAKAGDTVIVASGTYYQSRTNNDRFLSVLQPANSGTAGNPLTIKAQTQYGVVITYAVGVTGRGPLIGAYERNYVSWDGVVVQEVLVNNMTDTGPVVFAAGSANNRSTGDVLQNSEVIGVDDNGSINDNHNGIRLENTNNVTINNNKIHGVQYNHNGWQPSMIMMYAASGVTVQNNDIYMVPSVVNCCGGYGVYPKGGNASDGVYGNHNITIRYNLIHDVGTGIKQSFTAQSNFYQNILYNIDNVAFENAESCNNLDCSANTQYSDFPGMANIDINFYNNTIYNAYQGITFYSQPDRALGGGADWRNNIIYMTQNPANMLGSDNNTNGGAYITYQNFASDYSDYFACCGSPVNGPNFRFTATNQTLSQWQSDTTWSSKPNGFDVHSITSDPLFVNAAVNDFHLKANSPALLAGTDFGNILGNGTSAPITMGAYVTGSELIGLTTQRFSLNSPNPPQNLAVK
jgi:hypothetical protein